MSWLFANMVWASAAMLLVLLIRQPVARAFGAGAAYSLWLLPALRLISPPGEWFARHIGTSIPSPLPPLAISLPVGGNDAAQAAAGFDWGLLLIALWVVGAMCFLIWHARRYRHFLTQLSLSMASAGSFRGLPLVESRAIDGPLALGVLDRRIVIPADFHERYSCEERQLALAHEHHHHRRGDIIANHLALLFLALNWFNPLAHFAFRAFRADQELACDAAVATSSSGAVRLQYGQALVKAASHPGLVAVCPLNQPDQLKRRLKMLKLHRRSFPRAVGGAVITATLIAVSLIFVATPGAVAEAAHPQTEMDAGASRSRVYLVERASDVITVGNQSGAPGVRVLADNMPADLGVHLERCRGGDKGVIEIETQAGGRAVLLCARNGEGRKSIQELRERIIGSDRISEEMKQRILKTLGPPAQRP